MIIAYFPLKYKMFFNDITTYSKYVLVEQLDFIGGTFNLTR